MRLLGLAALVVVAGATLAPRAALGWQDSPAQLATHLGLSPAPRCDLCHVEASAPVGAAAQPFCEALVARGLTKDDASKLDAAVDRLRADKVDSDGDGAQDLDELSWGGDPNHADVPQSSDAPAAYGCAMRAGATAGSGWASLALAMGALATRRRRRPRRERALFPRARDAV